MLPIKPIELHPILVHFPIALLLTSVVLDFLALILKRWGLAVAATWCLVFGVPAAAVAMLAGQISEGHIVLGNAGQILSMHKLFAEGSGLIFGFLLIARLVWLAPSIIESLAFTIPRMRPALANMQHSLLATLPGLKAATPPAFAYGLYMVISVAGLVCLSIAGYLGGELVYTYGVVPH